MRIPCLYHAKRLIHTHTFQLTSNGFSVLDAEMQSTGVGIYPNVSLLNHSCWANCVVIFEGLKLNVRPIRKIEIGEEVRGIRKPCGRINYKLKN